MQSSLSSSFLQSAAGVRFESSAVDSMASVRGLERMRSSQLCVRAPRLPRVGGFGILLNLRLLDEGLGDCSFRRSLTFAGSGGPALGFESMVVFVCLTR